MPPEYTKHGKISPKLDAFSFGVCLLEMLSGRRATEDLLELFDAHTERRDLPAVLDPRLVDQRDAPQAAGSLAARHAEPFAQSPVFHTRAALKVLQGDV